MINVVLSQIRATVTTKWGNYYKLGQNILQIKASIANFKLEHNNDQRIKLKGYCLLCEDHLKRWRREKV